MSLRRPLSVGVLLALSHLASAQEMRGVLNDVSLDASTGTYTLLDRPSGWRLSGTIGVPLKNVRTGTGKDDGGPFREMSFEWTAEVPLRGTIRLYDERPAAFFRLTYLAAKTGKSIAFPNFTAVPQGLKGFSYEDQAFFPGRFSLAQTSTPWLLFDERARSLIFSPASQFLVAKMVGDGKANMGAALNDRIVGVPKGLRQESLLVFGGGVGRAWDDWGEALRALHGRSSDAVAKDPVVRSYGYWTDNGADYYYHYDDAKGYAGTLLALRDHYRDAGLPLGYLQLDSWWYRKLTDTISRESNPKQRNPKYPPSEWNRYGGVLEYRAATELFPNGLAAFSKAVGLPFIVHGRWIDGESPLRQKFEISGVGPVDPKYWNDTAGYLATSGVESYEQDWMDAIYAHSPQMATTVGVADAFADGMANAMRARGLTMQYCMATPRFVLNGVRYPNLTTVRTSPDRFEPKKWAQFILGAPLTRGVGAVPWSDVFRSRETGNAIVATLSAGPVGNGDAIGTEDKANILRVARPDGIVVRPDEPLVPTDATYLSGADGTGEPFVATTSTEHGGLRTRYLFAFPREAAKLATTLSLRSLGVRGRTYVVDLVTGEGRFVEPDEAMTIDIGDAGFAYRMVTPVTQTGIAFLGDWGKFAPTGRARIASVDDRPDGLRVRVAFAKGEGPVTVEGVSAHTPKVSASRGGARLLRYEASSGRFAVEVTGEKETAEIAIDGRE